MGHYFLYKQYLHCRGYGVFSKTRVELHLVKGPDATSQPLVLNYKISLRDPKQIGA